MATKKKKKKIVFIKYIKTCYYTILLIIKMDDSGIIMSDNPPTSETIKIENYVRYKAQDFGFDNNLKFATYKNNGRWYGNAQIFPDRSLIKGFETEEDAKNWVIKEMRPRTKGINVNNTSGCKGVHRTNNRGYEFWVATIKVKGKLYSKRFSTRKYDNAKELAVSWRKQKEKEFKVNLE